jgi:glycosyltransferase involved in cell wall biosynthesis
MRVLHVVHDFLPKYCAGTEIYVYRLAREQQRWADVTVLCADYDLQRPHASVRERTLDGLPVVEIVNNWHCHQFTDTYASPVLEAVVADWLDRLAPDVVHVHGLSTLPLSVPTLARRRGAQVVMTLHDYSLLCPSGGKRVHLSERHVCVDIDVQRCARCFPQSNLGAQITVAALPASTRRWAVSAAKALAVVSPAAVQRLRTLQPPLGAAPQAADIARRMAAVGESLRDVSLIVAPSQFIADEFRRLDMLLPPIEVSDNGQHLFAPIPHVPRRDAVRIGFIGTVAWEKGVHVLIDAARRLRPGGFEVRIFGDDRTFPDYASKLRAAARDLPVTFAGAFAPERLSHVLAEIDVVVVPSLWLENSPLVVHEAFIAGVPVIAARIGGLTELLGGGELGTLYDTADELAAALQRVVDAPDLAQRAASSRPPVKSMVVDAEQWRARYTRVRAAARNLPVEVTPAVGTT